MDLAEKLSKLPDEPGVYLMKNGSGAVIYVGKAKSLKNRVRSYFNTKDHQEKTRALVAEIHDFELILTDNEVEALLLERSLIKHNKPHYNILLRDDKEYPFVRVDFNSPWPRLEKVRRQKDDRATYLGPFSNEGMLNLMLKTIYRIFPLCRCSPYVFRTAKRPCTYYHMNMCLAPCALKVDREVYVAMVRDAVAVLQGKGGEIKKNLLAKMDEAAANEKYEVAALFRDQLNALEVLAEKQVAMVKVHADVDVIACAQKDHKIVFHVLSVRDKRIVGSENFLSTISIDSLEEALISFALQYYGSRLPPRRIVFPIPLEEAAHLMQAISPKDSAPPLFHFAQKGELALLMALSEKNAEHYISANYLSRERTKTELAMAAELIGLATVPSRIECIDISGHGESAIVAALVCFIDGVAVKEFYRHYKLKTVQGSQDDFASIFEIVTRRLERARKEGDPPDMLMIDGGKGQLSAALKAKQAFSEFSDMPVVAIAKSRVVADALASSIEKSSERIFLPNKEDPIELVEGTPAFRLFVRIRDETHRFAIGFHRKRVRAGFTQTLLDTVPGIGPALKKRLLNHFRDMEGICAASLEELIAVPGLSEKIATRLYSSTHADE